ncbi:MAG: cupin domain-containing protein [Neomegalonema sp.]|nr:cupin domain-containing protein [Neomegalonema sp.]
MTVLTREELLAAYGAGTTSPGMSLLCAVHLDLDAGASRLVGAAEELGGTMLQALPVPPQMTPPDLAAMMARLDEPEAGSAQKAVSLADTAIPAAVRAAISEDDRSVPWRFRMPGLSEYVLPGFDGEKVSLLRARPGVAIPHHDHHGDEATLVLKGHLKDGESIYERGQIAFAGEGHHHHPEIVGDDICICLAVSRGLHFTGLLGPALNYLVD